MLHENRLRSVRFGIASLLLLAAAPSGVASAAGGIPELLRLARSPVGRLALEETLEGRRMLERLRGIGRGARPEGAAWQELERLADAPEARATIEELLSRLRHLELEARILPLGGGAGSRVMGPVEYLAARARELFAVDEAASGVRFVHSAPSRLAYQEVRRRFARELAAPAVIQRRVQEGLAVRNHSFTGLDFSEVRFARPLDAAEADLTLVSFRASDLSGAKLERVRGLRTDFSGARLYRTQLSGARLAHVDLKDAVLREAVMEGARLENVSLVRADLSEAWATGLILGPVDARGANLSRARLGGSRWFDGQLEGARFGEADLTLAKFEGCRLGDADFRGADLRGVTFRGVDLGTANFKGARLDRARMTRGVFERLSARLKWSDADVARLEIRIIE